MKKLINQGLQYDLHSILEARVLLQCREVDGEFFMEWVISKSPLHKVAYQYSNRQTMMEDHYIIAGYYFQLNPNKEPRVMGSLLDELPPSDYQMGN